VAFVCSVLTKFTARAASIIVALTGLTMAWNEDAP
jgi:hypothetical protein